MGIFRRNYQNTMNLAMKKCIDDYKVIYSRSHSGEMKKVNKIFKHAHKMINKMSPTDIMNGMVINNVSAECGALNILQNFAMIYIKPCSDVEFMMDEHPDAAFNLYEAINEEKLKRGLISKEQYDENKTTGLLIRLGKR